VLAAVMEEFKKSEGIKLTTKMKKKTTKTAPRRYTLSLMPPPGTFSVLLDVAILAMLTFAASTLFLMSLQLCQKVTITVGK
jgi:hypothetical protein